jgi:hypothetical protein
LRYKLTAAGIAARNELLCLLDIRPESDGSFNISAAHVKLKPKRAKDSRTTFGDLLAHPPHYSVAFGEINNFFAERLENIVDRYKGQCHSNCDIHDGTLSEKLNRCTLINDVGLREYFYHYYENNSDKDKWNVPTYFYTHCDAVRLPRNKIQNKSKSTRNIQAGNIINPAKKISDLLWNLDYHDQQKYFTDRIDEYFSHAIAFSVAAPRPTSEREGSLQEWISCRLGRAMDSSVSGWQSRAQQILLEPLECKSGSGSTGWGLVEMCQTIETVLLANGVPFSSSKPDDIIDALAKYSATTPVLIQVRNLHYEQSSREILINIFWKNLIKQASKIALSRSTKRSRLIMLVLEDNNSPQDEANFFYPLRQLDINFADVDKWALPEQVKIALARVDEWNDGIDREVDDLIDKEIRGWPCWNEPRIEIKLPDIFEGLCRLLNSGYGSKRVSEYWKI